MLVMIQNDQICVTVDTLGAQLMSIRSAEGIEYLWQGDAKYWSDRAPILFPFIGRLTKNSYQYKGKQYAMEIHGFANKMDFEPVEQGCDYLVLELKSTMVTITRYPFDFTLRVIYALNRNKIEVVYQVENRSDRYMPFAIGGHPGFRVPLLPEESFEDYELEFTRPCQPDRVGFTPAVFLSGHDEAYPFEKKLNLRHDLFDEDAIILKNMDREITLRSRVSHRGVCLSYPDMSYLGIWHWPKTDAPYVCIEPWCSLPSREGEIAVFEEQEDLIRLPAGDTYRNVWTIQIRMP